MLPPTVTSCIPAHSPTSDARAPQVSAVMMNHQQVLGFGWKANNPAMFLAEDVFSGELSKQLTT